jgi:hypothetical protein
MTIEASLLKSVEQTTILERATRLIELEDDILAELVANEEELEDEQAFRLARRAEWLAIDMVWAGLDGSATISTATYVEMMRVAVGTFPKDDYINELEVEYAELIRKIAA